MSKKKFGFELRCCMYNPQVMTVCMWTPVQSPWCPIQWACLRKALPASLLGADLQTATQLTAHKVCDSENAMLPGPQLVCAVPHGNMLIIIVLCQHVLCCAVPCCAVPSYVGVHGSLLNAVLCRSTLQLLAVSVYTFSPFP